jgi:hypothetical protein
MALVALPLAYGDLTMNHLVSEKWPCLTVFEKRALKARSPLPNFIGYNFREIIALESWGMHFCTGRKMLRKSHPRQRQPAGKVQHGNNFHAAFKAHSFSRRIETFLTTGSRNINSLTLPKILMMK